MQFDHKWTSKVAHPHIFNGLLPVKIKRNVAKFDTPLFQTFFSEGKSEQLTV